MTQIAHDWKPVKIILQVRPLSNSRFLEIGVARYLNEIRHRVSRPPVEDIQSDLRGEKCHLDVSGCFTSPSACPTDSQLG